MPQYKESSSNYQRKLRKRRISGFRNYCKQLCEHSLITGFPVIASTPNLLRKAIKVLVFLGCLCGFLYQTFQFLELYMTYPTIIDIRIYKPTEIESPAISFCNVNRIRRKSFCTDDPHDCAWMKNRTKFCYGYPRYCRKGEDEAETVLGIPFVNAIGTEGRSREYVQKFGESFKDFVQQCWVETQVSRHCKNPVNVSWVDGGFPYNCFTVESLWGLPEAQVQKMPLNGLFYLHLKLQPEQYLQHFKLVAARIFFHQANSLRNPFMEGITLKAGANYHILINQEVTERLPAPYQTNCIDYIKLWKENGGYGPLTRKECIEKCFMENMLETNDCVAQTVNYAGNYKICENSNIFVSNDVNEKCSLQCKDACREISYYITDTDVYDDLALSCDEEDKNCMNEKIIFSVFFHRLEVQKSVHQPRYESIELFSYIGGYMGMWLGISLVAVFDFLETLMALITYICRNKKKKASIELFSYIGGYMGMWLGISLVAVFDFLETLMALITYICRNKKKKKAVHRY